MGPVFNRSWASAARWEPCACLCGDAAESEHGSAVPQPTTARGDAAFHSNPTTDAEPYVLLRKLAASFGAPLTLFSAHLAVGHIRCVLLAFRLAHFAGRDACPELSENGVMICSRLPAHETAGRDADIRTVQVESNALHDMLHGVFRETRVRACPAGLGAGETGFDALDQGASIRGLSTRVGFQHFFDM